jgi:hypothetical protein
MCGCPFCCDANGCLRCVDQVDALFFEGFRCPLGGFYISFRMADFKKGLFSVFQPELL